MAKDYAHEDSLPVEDIWCLTPDVTYLNHGSFGLVPRCVLASRDDWRRRIDSEPIDFFVRNYEEAWRASRCRLAQFVGTSPDNIILVDNATSAMNIVARSMRLQPGDEVLLTDHEYGAVVRIWKRACREQGAEPPVLAVLPLPVSDAEAIVSRIVSRVTPRTRLAVLSHVTSPTAIKLPVSQICDAMHDLGVAVCIDGPHAIAQLPLNLDRLGCDYYTASCHKWLSASLGTGLLYVHPTRQAGIQPANLSWGRLAPNEPQCWSDEFVWTGTRDPSAYLAIPAAIDFLEGYGIDLFREETHELAQYARRRLTELTQLEPLVANHPSWYGSMAHVPLPPGPIGTLQSRLWEQFRIEVPIIEWHGDRFIRVSCHLYNDRSQIDDLVRALGPLLDE